MTAAPLAPALAGWAEQLRAAGVHSPAHDTRVLAATVLGIPPLEVPLRNTMSVEQRTRIDSLVDRRALREPLQHILGTAAFYGLELLVGPGVFVPRPETESLAGYTVAWLFDSADSGDSVVVDLCSGSGALALAVGCNVAGATVIGVERSPAALGYAHRNLQRCRPAVVASSIELVAGDATDPDLLSGLSGRVDAVISNPPYIPDAAVPRDPEVRDYDPPMALYGGDDGLAVVRGMLPVAARLLRSGGMLAVEHGDEQGGVDGLPGLIGAAPGFDQVADHADLAGRPRFTTAVRSG